jgi:muramoyltetrapeptide carboxypeptidase
MMYALKHAVAFKGIRGLIVGGMTDMKDTEVSFGMDIYDIVLSHLKDVKIPVCFDFPCGHIDDNRAMILGAEAFLLVTDSNVELSYV